MGLGVSLGILVDCCRVFDFCLRLSLVCGELLCYRCPGPRASFCGLCLEFRTQLWGRPRMALSAPPGEFLVRTGRLKRRH